MSKLTNIGGVSLPNKPDPFAWDSSKLEWIGNTINYANLLSSNVTSTVVAASVLYVTNASTTTGLNFNSGNGLVLCPNGTTFYVSQIQGAGQGYIQKYNLKLKNFMRTLSQNVNGEATVFGNSVVYVGNAVLTNMTSSVQGLRFSTNGHCFYVIEGSQNSIKQYNCSSPFEALTSTYRANSAVLTNETYPRVFEWKPDGTKVIVAGSSGKINEYTVSQAWNVETISYRTQITRPTEIKNLGGLKFTKDGKTCFMADYGLNFGVAVLWQYRLTEGWNVETFDVTAVANTSGLQFYQGTINDIDIDQSGKYFYLLDNTYDTIVQYNFIFNKGLDTSATTSYNTGLSFSSDGTKLYTLYETSPFRVFQYNLDVPWNTDNGVSVNYKNVNTAVNESMTNFWMHPQGTKFYVMGDRINEFNMSETWNVASATLGSNIAININYPGTIGKTVTPGIWTWKPDGTKFYILDNSSTVLGNYGKLQEYKLSTPWDITTVSWSANGPNVNFFSTRSTTTAWTDAMYWHPNGKILYTFNATFNNFTKFVFSESWNVLTMSSWSNNYGSFRNEVTGSFDNRITGLYVRSDGKLLYQVSRRPSFVKKYRFLGYEVPDNDFTSI